MSCILFVSTFNQRSRDTESLMLAFQRQGHRVISLSFADGSEIHDFLRQHGISTFEFHVKSGIRWLRHWRNIRYLVALARAQNVNVIYSHLEYANFIAAIAQLFIKSRVIICRHHADQYRHLGIDKDLSYRLTYALAKIIVVVSEAARAFMVKYEGVKPSKILHINLAYDFSLYPPVDPKVAASIRQHVNAEVVLITVGRFSATKRTELSVRTLKVLVDKGIDAKLILLGSGETRAQLDTLIGELQLLERVIFPGYVSNVLDYLSASTFLLHPSISEASCVVVKEAALTGLPVLVCEGVGDFDSYMQDGVNGFLVDQHDFPAQAAERLAALHNSPDVLRAIGGKLRESVLRNFSIENVIDRYHSLNQV